MAEIEIAGNGYNVLPGTYKRAGDMYEGAIAGTWKQTDFVGGMLRTIQLERDRAGNGLCVIANSGGMGVEPWPFKTTAVDGTLATAGTVRQPSIIAGNNCYVAIDRFLYQSVTLGAASWGSWTLVYTAPVADRITHLAQVGTKVVCCRISGDMNAYDIVAGTNAAYVVTWRGFRAVGYSGALVWSEGLALDTLSVQLGASTKQSWKLDAPIEMIALHAGEVVVATKANMYTLGGRKIVVDKMIAGVATPTDVWSEDPKALFTPGVWTDDEDYQFVLSFGGKLYTWLGNTVMEYDPTGDNQGWRATMLDGRSCHGATVAGPYMIVAITARSGDSEVWAFDGSAWWLIDVSESQQRVWPIYTGGAGNIDVAVFRNGSGTGTHDLFRLVYRTNANHAYTQGAVSQYVSSMIHVDHVEAEKSWQAIGAVFARADRRGNPAGTGAVVLELDYSINGGRSWTNAGSTAIGDPEQRTALVGFDLGAAPKVSTYLMLRVRWSGVTDWAPVLAGIWAEWELVGVPARRRRWHMSIEAKARSVNPLGDVDARDGYTMANDLWLAWSTSAGITFHDVDYDTTAIEHNVQVVAIAEEMKVTDRERVGHQSTVKLQLVEL